MKNKNIISVTNLIKLLDENSLRNEDVVINLIRSFGLVQWGPPVFGLDETWKNPSTEMAGIYQIPKQLAQALIYLSSKKINSYCEIGIFQGGNFVFVSEYLRKFNPDIKCVGIDPTNYLNPEIRSYLDENEWMQFKSCTSDDIAGEKFDLVLIDGNHIDGWVNKDWENLGKHASICMIHDIQEPSCQEVIEFWGDLKEKYEIEKFTYCTTEQPTMGIGIIYPDKVKFQGEEFPEKKYRGKK